MSPASLAALHAAGLAMPRPWSAAEFAALLMEDAVFVAGDRTGFALGRVVLDEAELLTLVTAPGLRRRGIGRDRLARFEAEATRCGARRAFLEVASSNLPARALYAAAGWRETGRRRGYYRAADGSPIDALILDRRLGAA